MLLIFVTLTLAWCRELNLPGTECPDSQLANVGGVATNDNKSLRFAGPKGYLVDAQDSMDGRNGDQFFDTSVASQGVGDGVDSRCGPHLGREEVAI
jgi:hypothetical protein